MSTGSTGATGSNHYNRIIYQEPVPNLTCFNCATAVKDFRVTLSISHKSYQSTQIEFCCFDCLTKSQPAKLNATSISKLIPSYIIGWKATSS